MNDNVDDALEQQEAERQAQEQQNYNHELLITVDRGFAVQQFLDGELGRWLKAEALKQRAGYLEDLVLLDADNADDRSKIRELRTLIGIIDLWDMFFKGFVQEGSNARQKLERQDHPD